MSKYLELKYNNKIYTEKYQIEEILVKEKFSWFIEMELFNSKIEILNNTLVFNGGTIYNGISKFMAFRDGLIKSMVWEDGVFFNGTANNMLFKNGIIFNCNMYNCQILNAKIRTKNQNNTPTKQEFIECDISSNVKKV